ncbi:halocin C8-like domain-containing protein [Halostella sp. PRR32]|uniref:halocin C8-like domain-containing protein n=1 Tax=Halostella sp. PRR32 TaxID=3098147 RepID=UPI002B1E849F|nr:halocin C8-like domain-containing protein [Halostella sp. PRR32]
MSDRNDTAEDVAEELNEQVDAGGCGETWDAMSRIRDRSDGQGRRKFLRMGAATVSLVTLGASSVSADEFTDEDEVDTSVYDELTDAEARRAFARLSRTSEFHALAREVRERGHELDREGILVGRVDSEEQVDLASVPIKGADADEAYLTIGRSLDTGTVTVASLEYVEKPDADAADAQSVDDLDGTITAETVDALDGMSTSTHTADFSGSASETNAVTADDWDIGCWGCKKAVEQICRIGCGASTAFICGVLSGMNIIAGGGCFTFTQAACYVISKLGCGVDYEAICSHDRLDLC